MNFVVVDKELLKPATLAAEASPARHQLPVLVAEPAGASHVRVQSPAEPTDNRRANRKAVKLAGRVADGSQQSFSCTVHDMSAMGAMLELHRHEVRRHGGEIQLPERFFLVMENLLERSVVECYVMWRRANRAGVQFVGPIDSTTKKLPARKVATGKAKPSIRIRR